MSQLKNKSNNKIISENFISAKNFTSRNKGLIGVKYLDGDTCLWIKNCNWIHTFFMKMKIDVLYLDKNFNVKKIDFNVKPWRLPAPVLRARSVIEFEAGSLKNVKIGDQLHVVG